MACGNQLNKLDNLPRLDLQIYLRRREVSRANNIRFEHIYKVLS